MFSKRARLLMQVMTVAAAMASTTVVANQLLRNESQRVLGEEVDLTPPKPKVQEPQSPSPVANAEQSAQAEQFVGLPEQRAAEADDREPVNQANAANDSALLAKQAEPEHPYLRVVRMGDRLRVDGDGTIHFVTIQGSLYENIQSLMEYTSAGMVVSRISVNHSLYNRFEISGGTILEVIDKMVLPFSSPRPVVGTAWVNNVVELKYASSGEKND